MGAANSSSKTSSSNATKLSAFKLFEYACPNCKTKRPIQYFCRNGSFLPQTPRVVCGECSMSVTVEPFKTVDYMCAACRRWQKVRLPAKPVPLNMYNVSVVNCNCGFRGEVPVGRLMDVTCSTCWQQKRELRGTWTEDGDEVKTHCQTCQDYRRAFAREPKKKSSQADGDLEYNCENCFRVQPVRAEELLRSEGLACCPLCAWVGYPEVVPRGSINGRAGREAAATGSEGEKQAKARAAEGKSKGKGRPRPPSSSLGGGVSQDSLR